MRVLMVAGGTAGHINPALAIADAIRQQWPDTEIHFAGRKGGMEYKLVRGAGYPFHPIEVHGIQRSFTPKNILRNAKAAWHLAFAPLAARKILREVKPDLVVGAGGYVSGPVVLEAAKSGIKTAIHEQNAYPGVTNRILAKHVGLVMLPTQSAVERLNYPGKSVVTGNPVRPAFFNQDRAAARADIGAAEGQVVVLSYGGSLGALRVNQLVADFAAWHLSQQNFFHIHATGSIEKESFAALAREKGIANNPRFIIREYIDNMPEMYAAADLVISRAGALTLAELAAEGRASILIPSPNVAENHQYYNAMEYQRAGAAKVFEEKDLTAALLIQNVQELAQNPDMLTQMGHNARSLARPDSLKCIVDALQDLMRQ